MPKYFEIEKRVVALVEAEDEAQAMRVAFLHDSEIVSDFPGEFEVVGEVRSLKELPEGWDGDCIPYGGDGYTPTRLLLPEDLPERDTRTADMFAAMEGKS